MGGAPIGLVLHVVVRDPEVVIAEHRAYSLALPRCLEVPDEVVRLPVGLHCCVRELCTMLESALEQEKTQTTPCVCLDDVNAGSGDK